jgi:hypothetical protein
MGGWWAWSGLRQRGKAERRMRFEGRGRASPSALSNCEVAVIDELVRLNLDNQEARTGTDLVQAESICVKFTVTIFIKFHEAPFACNLLAWRG